MTATRTIVVRCVAIACLWPTSALAQRTGSSTSTTAVSGSDSIILDRTTVIVEGSSAPAPIREATEDLAADFEKVFGARPKIVEREQGSGEISIVIGEAPKLPESLRPSGLDAQESFVIATPRNNSDKAGKIVLLSGADVRGTMFAIYEFSRKYLGIDPLYYWTDREPIRRTSVRIAARLDERFSAPAFKYRGFSSTTKIC